MTATDELRRLLDERGVEYRFNECTKVFEWHFNGTDGEGSAHATEVSGGINIIACSLTPEQAIDATLGRGTCHETIIDHYWRGCGSCGYIWEFMYGIGKCERPRYCPACGKRVVEP